MEEVRSKSRGRLLVGGIILLLGFGGLGAWMASRSFTDRPAPRLTPALESSDPRRTYSGPYRNVHPDVRYVGDASCVDCHKDITRSFAAHPMGHSLVPVASHVDKQRYTLQTNNPFTAFGRRFEVRPAGQHLWHRQEVPGEVDRPAIDLAAEVKWVIGSGAKGFSYLTERDGYVVQTPISWYSQKQRWDLSPGFTPSALVGRIVPASCLFCHTNHVLEHPEHVDRFVMPVFQGYAIGCERCHGPGELHVKGDMDHTIVNPARLPKRLRDAVCEQCHLEGEARVLRAGRRLFDYRPGLPLHDFWAVLVPAHQKGTDARAVHHVEQMYQSKCFQRSNEREDSAGMGCTTCHDPHVHAGAATRRAHFRAACLKCHTDIDGPRSCSLPRKERLQKTAEDSCIDCHMPRYANSDVAHAASTDHSIVRRAGSQAPAAGIHAVEQFEDFYRERFARGDPQADRNRALGLVKMLASGMASPERDGETIARLLEVALAGHPEDAELRASKALVLGLLGRSSESLAEARRALANRQGDWRLLAQAGRAAQAEGKLDEAAGFWRRAVEINPLVPEHYVSLIAVLIRMRRLEEVELQTDKLLQLDPFNVSGRQSRVGSLLQQGKKAAAQREFELIRRLRPPDLDEREGWFRKQMR
jgi:predicted CXXCH cytochrome family protein